MNPTRNSLPLATRKQSVELLNEIVSDLFDLYARTKQAHWNLRGSSFIGLHKLLDEFAKAIGKHLDAVAERAKALGGVVEGTLHGATRGTKLKSPEQPPANSGQREWLNELADSYAECGSRVRKAIEKTDDRSDFGTTDLLTDVLRDLDQQLWLFEAHLQK